MKLTIACLALLVSVPLPAAAQVEWAAWGAVSGGTATGTFVGGQTVTLTSHFDGITAGVPEGIGWNSASPLLPGRPDGTNPPYMQMVTGSPHPVVIPSGVVVLTLELNGMPIDTLTTIGFSDFKIANWYYLRLEDQAGAPLSLLGLHVTQHDITLTGNGWVADYDIYLTPDTGFMFANEPHSTPGAFYGHSGVMRIDHLPPTTARVVVTSGRSMESEGITIYAGRAATTPVEPTTWSGIKRLVAG